MIKYCYSLLFLLINLTVAAQSDAQSYSKCDGALNIFKSGTYQLQFTGNKGTTKSFSEYNALSNYTNDNLVWVSFLAPSSGELSFNAKSTSSSLNYVIFERYNDDICMDVKNGHAEIKRILINTNNNVIGLSKEVNKQFLYPLHIDKSRLITIVFIAGEGEKSMVDLDFNFTPDIEEDAVMEQKIIDQRDDDFAPTFSIEVRNAETNQPIVANLTIGGHRDIAALYKGSDFFFNLHRSGKLSIQCDAEGFFFFDTTEVAVSSLKNEVILIKLEPVRSGKSMQIEEIEFKPGTSEFMPSADGKLRRLRDFLALNSDVRIEIQGHVDSRGDNSFAGQRISEARAKRVLKYLIDSGIDKSRLESKGYGNTKPIYEHPKFSYEEQANRRVEIVVL